MTGMRWAPLRRGSVLLVAVAASLLLADLTAAWAGGTLRIGRNEDSSTMDPIKTAQGVDAMVIDNIHAALVRSNRDATGIEPDLAESWEVSDDKLTYSFTLRDDESSVYGTLFQVIESLEARDEKTLEIRLTEPSAPFLSTIAMYTASILPQAAVEALGEDFGTRPVGAGVYRIADWQAGERLTLVPNEHHYAAPISKVDRVEWQVVPDDTTRVLKVISDELDVAILVPFAMLPVLEAEVQVHLDPSTREDHILFNHENEWLAKKPVRQAINLALDLETITQLSTAGQGTVANSLIPSGTLYYNPENPAYPFDQARAKALIAEAGAEGASLEYVVPAGNVTRENIAAMVQLMLSQVGLYVTIREVDPSVNWQTLIDGDYDMAAVYWIYDLMDPDGKIAFSVSADDNLSYFTRYDNPEVTALVEEARRELDADKRRDLYYEIQARVKEDAHWVDLYYSPFSNISRKTVTGFYQNPMGVIRLQDIGLE